MKISTDNPAAAGGAEVARVRVAHTVRSATLSTGVTLNYVEQGDPAGVPVLMLHGFTDSWHSFEPVLPHLPKSIHALALTQRGHGDSARPAGGYRTRDFAADVAAFTDELDLGPVVIVGHSMGSTNALRFTIDYPDRTRGLMLVGAFASYRNNPAVMEFWEHGVSTLTDPIDVGFVHEFQQSTLAQPVADGLVEQAVQESLKVPARVWREALAGCVEDDFIAGMQHIAVPTLALWGDRDTLVPRGDQETFLATIAGARLTVYQGGGHAPHWEAPARFAADVVAFALACSRR